MFFLVVFIGLIAAYIIVAGILCTVIEFVFGCSDVTAQGVTRTLLLIVAALYVASLLTSCKPKPAPAKPYEPLTADTIRPALERKVQRAESTRAERTHQSHQTEKPYEDAAADYDAWRRTLGL